MRHRPRRSETALRSAARAESRIGEELHMAVDERNALAVQILLDGGADPEV
jgi:hypothetical protein